MKIILPQSTIADVTPKKEVVIYCDEENIRKVLDNISMKNLLKYIFERQRRIDNA